MEKTKVFLLGFLAALGLMILLGAGPGGITKEVGRYQQVMIGQEMGGRYSVLDTSTGQVQWYDKGKNMWNDAGNPWQ